VDTNWTGKTGENVYGFILVTEDLKEDAAINALKEKEDECVDVNLGSELCVTGDLAEEFILVTPKAKEVAVIFAESVEMGITVDVREDTS